MSDQLFTELPAVGAWRLQGAYEGHEVVQFTVGDQGIVLRGITVGVEEGEPWGRVQPYMSAAMTLQSSDSTRPTNACRTPWMGPCSTTGHLVSATMTLSASVPTVLRTSYPALVSGSRSRHKSPRVRCGTWRL